MSFLDQLKSQASALQRQQSTQQQNLAQAKDQTEAACNMAWYYLSDLAKQLSVISPPGPAFNIDGKTPWPPMKLTAFRVDSRKKMLRAQEVYDYIGMWWRVVPMSGQVQTSRVSVNFPPDLQRVESRIAQGQIKHERKEIRDPEKNSLRAIEFLMETETRGTLTITPDHDKAELAFRVTNARGLDVVSFNRAATQVKTEFLDELAKLVMGQPTTLG